MKCIRSQAVKLLSVAVAILLMSPAIDPAKADRSDASARRAMPYSYPQTVYAGTIAGPVDPELATFAKMMAIAFPRKSLKSFFDGKAHTTIFAPTDRSMIA